MSAAASVFLGLSGFPMLSLALRSALADQADLELAGELRDPDRLVAEVADSRANLAVLECAPGARGTEVVAELREACPDVRILALDTGSGSERAAALLRAGADGFLARDASPAELVAALEALLAGQTYVSSSLVTRMIAAYVRSGEMGMEDPFDQLTQDERELALLAAAGHTNRQIAEILGLSARTVHTHRARVMEKLGLHDRIELLRFAIRRGLLDPETL